MGTTPFNFIGIPWDIVAALQTSGFSAFEGHDYTSQDNMMVSVSRSSPVDINVPIGDDNSYECREDFYVMIQGPGAGAMNRATVTITDNDCK